MPGNDALYDVRERTKNPEHASVDDVVELVLKRVQHPRTEHRDVHLDEMMTTVVDRYGADPVRTVIHRVLVDHYPFRAATHDLEMRNVTSQISPERKTLKSGVSGSIGSADRLPDLFAGPFGDCEV